VRLNGSEFYRRYFEPGIKKIVNVDLKRLRQQVAPGVQPNILTNNAQFREARNDIQLRSQLFSHFLKVQPLLPSTTTPVRGGGHFIRIRSGMAISPRKIVELGGVIYAFCKGR